MNEHQPTGSIEWGGDDVTYQSSPDTTWPEEALQAFSDAVTMNDDRGIHVQYRAVLAALKVHAVPRAEHERLTQDLQGAMNELAREAHLHEKLRADVLAVTDEWEGEATEFRRRASLAATELDYRGRNAAASTCAQFAAELRGIIDPCASPSAPTPNAPATSPASPTEPATTATATTTTTSTPTPGAGTASPAEPSPPTSSPSPQPGTPPSSTTRSTTSDADPEVRP